VDFTLTAGAAVAAAAAAVCRFGSASAAKVGEMQEGEDGGAGGGAGAGCASAVIAVCGRAGEDYDVASAMPAPPAAAHPAARITPHPTAPPRPSGAPRPTGAGPRPLLPVARGAHASLLSARQRLGLNSIAALLAAPAAAAASFTLTLDDIHGVPPPEMPSGGGPTQVTRRAVRLCLVQVCCTRPQSTCSQHVSFTHAACTRMRPHKDGMHTRPARACRIHPQEHGAVRLCARDNDIRRCACLTLPPPPTHPSRHFPVRVTVAPRRVRQPPSTPLSTHRLPRASAVPAPCPLPRPNT
jgi:hypothetical protein